MRLNEVFEQLSLGEFSQLSIGGQPAGVINEENYARVVGHVNMGLVALYSRFNLKTNHLVLELQDGMEVYHLKSQYAVNARRSQEPVRYILDEAHARFEDDLIKVEKVFGADGTELPLNDPAYGDSVYTLTDTSIKVPGDLYTDKLTIMYRANHPTLSVGLGYFDPARVEVELPRTHLQALLYYVASRVNNPVGMTNEFHAGNSYFAKYEQACAVLEEKGLQVDQGQTNTRAQRGGWC